MSLEQEGEGGRKRDMDHMEMMACVLRVRKAWARATMLTPSPSPLSHFLLPSPRQVADLKEVWLAVQAAWDALAALFETPWSAVQPRKVLVALEDIATRMHQARVVRSYPPYAGMAAALDGSAQRAGGRASERTGRQKCAPCVPYLCG